MTCFTRIVIVLSLLRSAMGVQQTPPNVVLISLALFLTAFVMAPTLQRVYDNGVAPLINEEIEEREAFAVVIERVVRGWLHGRVRVRWIRAQLAKARERERKAKKPLTAKDLDNKMAEAEERRQLELEAIKFKGAQFSRPAPGPRRTVDYGEEKDSHK